MSDYRQLNGEKYVTDYVPQVGEKWFGDSGDCEVSISSHNLTGNAESQEKMWENVRANLPAGATMHLHTNRDGSKTIIVKTPRMTPLERERANTR